MPDHAPVGSIVNQVMDHFMSTPARHSKVQQINNKENDLTSVQQQHNITSENAEAALKEWILTRSAILIGSLRKSQTSAYGTTRPEFQNNTCQTPEH